MVAPRRLIADGDRQGVEAAIRAAEQATSAEFVAAIARRVERYHGVSLTAGLIAALATSLAVIYWNPWLSLLHATGLQCMAFALVYALFELTPLAVWLAPRKAKAVKVRRFAHLLCFEAGLTATPNRSGVLLFIALAERQVEIVTDRGIDELVDTAEWQRIVNAFSATARSGKIAAALETAIRDLGTVLAKHFPAHAGQANRIPDRLIEL